MDDGYSAKDTRRPAFQRMVADLKKRKVDLILVTDLSRLSRNIQDFCGILELLKQHDSSFLSIKEQFDSSTPAGKMMLYNMINLAQFEREQTAERVALGCYARAMRGLLNGGPEILGFDKSEEKKNSYVVNEEEAAQVRTIFKTFLQCGSLNRTIRELETLGVRPKVKRNRRLKIVDRGLWTHQTLGDLLKNLAYLGKREVNKKNKGVDPKALKSHQQYKVVKASWPAIVKQELFDNVQMLLTENHAMERRRLKGAERRVFLVSGIVFCKECGRPMVGQSAHGKNNVHRYYVHSSSRGDEITCSIRRIRADEIEAAIGQHVTSTLHDGGYLDHVAKRMVGGAKDHKSAAKAARTRLRRELGRCEQEMEAAFKLQLNAIHGSKSEQFVLKKLEGLGKRKEVLENSLNEVGSSKGDTISLNEARESLENRIQKISKGWSKLAAGQKRRLLRRLIQRLEISPRGIDILYYPCELNESRTTGASSEESEDLSNVLRFSKGFPNSKLSVQNCVSARLANLGHHCPNVCILLIPNHFS